MNTTADVPSPLKIAIVVYPKMVLIDLVGPQTIFKLLNSDIMLVGETLAPVSTDVGIEVKPTHTLQDCSRDVDILFVPGGIFGTMDVIKQQTVLSSIREIGLSAKYVTSVCTGSLILGAAGLLNGYRATSHWGVLDLLSTFSAIPVSERVVHDRNRLTGAGATSGLDFGFTLAAMLRGEDAAKRIQLVLEYAPKPPFHHGDPSEISAEALQKAKLGRQKLDAMAAQAVDVARQFEW